MLQLLRQWRLYFGKSSHVEFWHTLQQSRMYGVIILSVQTCSVLSPGTHHRYLLRIIIVGILWSESIRYLVCSFISIITRSQWCSNGFYSYHQLTTSKSFQLQLFFCVIAKKLADLCHHMPDSKGYSCTLQMAARYVY